MGRYGEAQYRTPHSFHAGYSATGQSIVRPADQVTTTHITAREIQQFRQRKETVNLNPHHILRLHGRRAGGEADSDQQRGKT